MQGKYRRNILFSLTGILLFNCLFFTGLYIYDPLQLFHKSNNNAKRLHKNMREQAVGIINNYEFDSIIIGSSMLENTSANRAMEYFDEANINIGKLANLSISGSDFSIRKQVLDYLFHQRKINTVFYSIDYLLDTSDYNLETAYLYDQNPVNDFKIYLNKKYLTCYFTWSTSDLCLGVENSLDYPAAWYKEPQFQQNFGGKEIWVKNHDYFQISRAVKQIIEAADNISTKVASQRDKSKELVFRQFIRTSLDDSLFAFAKHYPDTDFYLIFPSYSRIQYAIWAQWDTLLFERYLMILRDVVSKSANYPNVKIYGFDTEPFLDNIANYKDLIHHSEPYNQQIMKWISEDKNQLTIENIELYIEQITALASNYNLQADADYFKNKLKDKLNP